jgi:hypothetical protein
VRGCPFHTSIPHTGRTVNGPSRPHRNVTLAEAGAAFTVITCQQCHAAALDRRISTGAHPVSRAAWRSEGRPSPYAHKARQRRPRWIRRRPASTFPVFDSPDRNAPRDKVALSMSGSTTRSELEATAAPDRPPDESKSPIGTPAEALGSVAEASVRAEESVSCLLRGSDG